MGRTELEAAKQEQGDSRIPDYPNADRFQFNLRISTDQISAMTFRRFLICLQLCAILLVMP